MNIDLVIAETLSVLEQFKPKSVFLYGSRGRGDFKPDSDYEIGVIFDKDDYIDRSVIHAAISNPNVKAYPFIWDELLHGTFSHVFQKSLYQREIIKGGKTIAGEDLIVQIQPLSITTLDLIQRLRFDIGMALAALLSYRSNDISTSMEEFSKACFFGVRSLEILELKVFPLGYDEIYELSKKVITEPKYQAVIEAAKDVRKGKQVENIDIIFENISLLDSYIEPKILAAFDANGNQQII